MRKFALLVSATLIAVQLIPSTGNAASWESLQPEMRVWLKNVDPDHQTRRSDADRPWVTAEVRSVDVPDGAISVHHGPIAKVGMPAMTMLIPVRDRSVLRDLKPGDTVDIQVAEESGVVRIVNLRPHR